jgi:hypothetical protein
LLWFLSSVFKQPQVSLKSKAPKTEKSFLPQKMRSLTLDPLNIPHFQSHPIRRSQYPIKAHSSIISFVRASLKSSDTKASKNAIKILLKIHYYANVIPEIHSLCGILFVIPQSSENKSHWKLKIVSGKNILIIHAQMENKDSTDFNAISGLSIW